MGKYGDNMEKNLWRKIYEEDVRILTKYPIYLVC